jgi:hypothetical protein
LQLNEGFIHRVAAIGATLLAFDHHKRNAIHEQHNIGNDKAFHTARRINAELVDGVKTVALRIGKVDQLHHRVLLARHLIHINLSLEQQGLDRLIRFEK